MDYHSFSNRQRVSLPESFRPLFWSYRFEDLDSRKDEKTVMIQLMNYGTLAHWRWLIRQYGRGEIRQVLQCVLPASLSKAA